MSYLPGLAAVVIELLLLPVFLSGPEDVSALKHPVTCPVPYSSPAQLVHTDGYLREPNCLDPKHGFEWYCEDGARALQISQDGSKAWCHRGPQ